MVSDNHSKSMAIIHIFWLDKGKNSVIISISNESFFRRKETKKQPLLGVAVFREGQTNIPAEKLRSIAFGRS